MVSALNGMALHGGLLPYGGTFLVFSDYARGALRLAALQQTHAIFVFTHDSIGMGEDGPTHQPIEQLVSLRAIPDFCLYPAGRRERDHRSLAARRPATGSHGTRLHSSKSLRPRPGSLSDRGGGPSGRIRSLGGAGGSARRSSSSRPVRRSPSPSMRRRSSATSVWRRGSCLCRAGACSTSNRRRTATRSSPPALPKVSIEAGTTLGWARYVGPGGASIGIDHFGASAPGPVLQREFGFTMDHVARSDDASAGAAEAGRVRRDQSLRASLPRPIAVAGLHPT